VRVVLHEVVVEIAADRARRHERRRQLEGLAARCLPRQHVHLDAPCDFELALEPLLRGRGFLQILDVRLQRVAHVVERLGELAHLVL